MPVQVKLFAAFAEFAGTRELQVQYKEGMTCKSLWQEIRERFPRLERIPVLFAVGEEYVPPETELHDGQVVMLFPPVSGGSSQYIFDEPISLDRAARAIQDEHAGGEAFFVGRVRRESHGKLVTYLQYDCEP